MVRANYPQIWLETLFNSVWREPLGVGIYQVSQCGNDIVRRSSEVDRSPATIGATHSQTILLDVERFRARPAFILLRGINEVEGRKLNAF